MSIKKDEVVNYMKYSIIIPIYNAEKVLTNCVCSIFETGLKDFEILLINDGSEDNSAAICKKLCKKYSQIKYIDQENLGVSAARNNGLRHARGKYILFCDADDFFEKDCFINIENILKYDIDVLIYGISLDYYYKGFCYRKDDLIYPKSGIQTMDRWSNDFKHMYDYNILSPVWNKIYRRDIILKYNLKFNTKMILLEDLCFSVAYLTYCNKIYFWNKIVYRYKQAEDERNAQKRLEKILSINFLMQSIRDCFIKANMIILKKHGYQLRGIDDICYQIYYMLVSQKMYYSTCKQIEKISEEVLKSDYCNESNLSNIGLKNLTLYKNLKDKKLWKIRMKNIYIQLKHFVAVRYKYCRCKRGKKYEY